VLAVIADILSQQATADTDNDGCVRMHLGFNTFCRYSCKIFCHLYRSGICFEDGPVFPEKTQHVLFH
ncbi:MAG: hypothetical protein ACC651_18145, partial [Candidatus Scalindua sp.]